MALTPQEINASVAEAFPSAAESGIVCIEVGDSTALARLDFDARGVRPGGIVPGPSVFALADAALWFVAFTKIGLAPMAVTSDMTIHCLRPASGSVLLAHCSLTKLGRRLAHGEIRVWQADRGSERLVTFASGTYALPKANSESADSPRH